MFKTKSSYSIVSYLVMLACGISLNLLLAKPESIAELGLLSLKSPLEFLGLVVAVLVITVSLIVLSVNMFVRDDNASGIVFTAMAALVFLATIVLVNTKSEFISDTCTSRGYMHYEQFEEGGDYYCIKMPYESGGPDIVNISELIDGR